MTTETTRVIPADHPSLPGHFPGAPIVPGVVILDEVTAVLMRSRPNCFLTEITSVKFLRPLKPAQPFVISLTANEKQIDFCCHANNEVIAKGRLEITGS